MRGGHTQQCDVGSSNIIIVQIWTISHQWFSDVVVYVNLYIFRHGNTEKQTILILLSL